MNTEPLTIEQCKDEAAREFDYKDYAELEYHWYLCNKKPYNQPNRFINRAMEIYAASALSSVREIPIGEITEVLNSCDETLSFIESWVHGSDYDLVYGERIKIQEYLKQLRLLTNKPNDQQGKGATKMNRQIKFHVIVTGNAGEKVAEFYEWLDGDGWKHSYYAPLVTNGVFSHYELGDGWMGEIIRRRFTGLLDKNGKEIYEGDIVKTKEHISMVHFSGGAFCKGNLSLTFLESEVIGNIHENGELL